MFFLRSMCAVLYLLTLGVFAQNAIAADHPNFLWIVSEDNSKHYLKHFDPNGIETPHIESLAKRGVTFNHAFSCSPVCSVARSTLITSVYGPRLGTHFHRKIEPVTLPESWELFPEILGHAGYYTTNNSKEDFNFIKPKNLWNESSKKASWRKRPNKDTPFFHMQSHSVSHESSLHFPSLQKAKQSLITDPKSVQIPPYYPDTELFRVTYARYLDRITQVDQIVGQVVEDLKKDDLLEDTFIFYFGDHGGVLPGSKGYLHESGLHVPLVIRVPDNWKHLVTMPPGTRVDGFVSFVDFGPTLLKLAGMKVPEYFDGKPILGPGISLEELNERDEAFGYADRFDEKYDLCRSLRKGNYKYLRNYQCYYPDSLQNNYRYKMLAYQEWRNLSQRGSLDKTQQEFFEPKPAEELYDLDRDPHETNNLANDPEFQSVLGEMRNRLSQRLRALPDLSFYPETVIVNEAASDPLGFGKSHQSEIARLIDIANLSTAPYRQAEPKLKTLLNSVSTWERYWAVTVCANFGMQATSLVETAKPLLEDSNLLVRIRAAEFFGRIHQGNAETVLQGVLAESESPVTSLIALNAVVYLRDHCDIPIAIDAQKIRAKDSLVERRLEYLVQRK